MSGCMVSKRHAHTHTQTPTDVWLYYPRDFAVLAVEISRRCTMTGVKLLSYTHTHTQTPTDGGQAVFDIPELAVVISMRCTMPGEKLL